MKCKLCGRELTNHQYEEYYDIESGVADREVVETYNKSASDIVNTIEFLLICLDCQHQIPYSYLWFAVSDGRGHVLTTKHKQVTITEIIWQNDKALDTSNTNKISSSIRTLGVVVKVDFV